jgi:hypothetical protein
MQRLRRGPWAAFLASISRRCTTSASRCCHCSAFRRHVLCCWTLLVIPCCRRGIHCPGCHYCTLPQITPTYLKRDVSGGGMTSPEFPPTQNNASDSTSTMTDGPSNMLPPPSQPPPPPHFRIAAAVERWEGEGNGAVFCREAHPGRVILVTVINAPLSMLASLLLLLPSLSLLPLLCPSPSPPPQFLPLPH